MDSSSSSSVTLVDDSSEGEWTDLDEDEDENDDELEDLDLDPITSLQFSFFKQSPLLYVSKDDHAYSWADHGSCDPSFSMTTLMAFAQARIQREREQAEGAPSIDDDNLIIKTNQILLKYKCGSIGTICDTMNERGGWVEQEDETSDDWDLDFMDLFELRDFNLKHGFNNLKENQRIGHFKNCFEIARKSYLIRNLKRFRYSVERCLGYQAGTNIDFFPTTFIVPYEDIRFQDEFRINPGNIWILKPASGAKGNGITIVDKLEDYLDWKEKKNKGELSCQQSSTDTSARVPNKSFPWHEQHDDYKYYPCPSYRHPKPRSRGYLHENKISGGIIDFVPRINIIKLEGDTRSNVPKTLKDVAVKTKTNRRPLTPDIDGDFEVDTDININNSAKEDLTIETDMDDMDDYCTQSYEDIIADTSFIKCISDDPFADGDCPSDLHDLNENNEDDRELENESDDSLWPPYNASEHEFGMDGMDAPKETFVVQRYISEPYLIGGKKFDLRIFVLVTSYDPLVAYTYREGFARFSVEQYSLSCTHDVRVHLTNVFVQRHSLDYSDGKGTKWSLNRLCQHFIEYDGQEALDGLMDRLDALVIRTLQSVAHRMNQFEQSFELYGFDILIDRHLKPWLLEVNASPAFTPSDNDDYQLKCRLIDDLVYVLDMEKRLIGSERRVGGWDLVWADGPIYRDSILHTQNADIEMELDSEDQDQEDQDEFPKLNSSFGASNDDRESNLGEILHSAHLVKNNLTRKVQKHVQKLEEYSEDGPFYPVASDTRFLNPFRPIQPEDDSDSE